MTIDPNKPMFPFAMQTKVINENAELIETMKTAKDIQQWNLNRRVVRAAMTSNPIEYIMLMGYIDSILFGQVFNLKKHART